jgi:hypothetical protein
LYTTAESFGSNPAACLFIVAAAEQLAAFEPARALILSSFSIKCPVCRGKEVVFFQVF